MGNRLSKIYTRTGDDGTTGLGDGSRIEKDTLRIEVIGTVDELNSLIGLLLTGNVPDTQRNILITVQHKLFDLGGELSIPGHTMVTANDVETLEQALDRMNESLSPLKEFILPGGSTEAAHCHLARSVCRRAERRIISLNKTESVNAATIQYLNRLSDLLFVMARSLNQAAGQPDVLWEHERK